MRRSSSSLSLLPLSKLVTANFSTVILFLVLAGSLFLPNAFGQGSSKRMLPASDENDRDQPQKRAQWNMRGREAPKGESAAALRLRAHQQKLAMRARRAATAAAQPEGTAAALATTWVSLGPSPLASDATGNGSQDYNWVSGRATSVLIDPADSTGNTVFLGGAYGGLWKSTNAGSKSATPDLVAWQSLIDDQPSLAVGAIALQPGNSNVILVGTGEANSSGDSYYGMGILRSTDGGATWGLPITSATSGQSFVGIGFSHIAFSTTNTNLAVASTAGDIGFDFGLEQDAISTARGLYYSIDAGATWNRVTLADNAVPNSVKGVVFDPSQGANGTFYAAIRRHGIYSSTDGQHFTRLATQPTTGLASGNCPATSNSTGCPIYRAEFAVTPGRNELYVWVVDVQSGVGEVDDGIWRTTNGGTSWTQISETGITHCGDSAFGTDSGCGVQQGAYNLELAAVPNSTGTDVYAGTINIYKCTLTSNTQTACSQGSWLNLTHVYGCSNLGAPAHVHPDQHGLAFLVVAGTPATAPGYFAHDGGISRTLDGYTGLTTGSCTGTNKFSSLSQTLGSMTEFVSFSVDPTSADNMLGGTQDNGSPKTSAATSSTTWRNALSGDGGFNAINPNNVSEWFTSNPGSVIWICDVGTSCDDNGAFLEAAPPNTFKGFPGNIDFGAFYTPYILDPQSTDEMLIGTCRVWRGAITPDENPGVFNQLSVNFDTGNALACNGGEVNQVAGLAAGGPGDTNGFSNVVYATTFGLGPFCTPANPCNGQFGGGEVWSTTNAATTGPSNVTGNINPKNYAIASVAIDTSMADGQTAFVGIMGFHTEHVWKTTNAGSSWTDWTGALPDAPVSSLLVDAAAGVIYAGTDVGLFSSPTSGTGGVWTEVGPAASSGAGFLPSAPVTAIRIFDNGVTKKLRVSTYGRGIWEFNLPLTPNFTLSANPAALSVPGTNGTSTIKVNPADGFTGSVSLSASGLPTGVTASFNPTSTTTTSTLTLTASNSATPTTATVTITGTSGSLTHTTTVALTVNQDVTVPSPLANPPNANPGQSTSTTMALAPAGGGTFTNNVTYACTSGLPTGATCSFSPTQINSGGSGQTVTVTVQTAGPFPGIASGTRPRVRSQKQPRWLPLSLPLAGMLLVGLAGRRMPRRYKIVGLCLALAVTGFLVACGGGSSSVPPPISVTVSPNPVNTLYPNLTVNGVQGTPQTQKFTATVANSTNAGVNWEVNGVAGGNATFGTIDTSGNYTAPAAVPSPATFNVTAVSQADATKSGNASVTIKTPTPAVLNQTVTVTVTEGTIQHTTSFNLTVN
jgi:hypothetical protein